MRPTTRMQGLACFALFMMLVFMVTDIEARGGGGGGGRGGVAAEAGTRGRWWRRRRARGRRRRRASGRRRRNLTERGGEQWNVRLDTFRCWRFVLKWRR